MASIRQCLDSAILSLQTNNEDARLDAELLLAHVLQCDLSHLIAWPEKPLTETQQTDYQQLIGQRAQGIPVAYLKGTKEFWSRPFEVDTHTLIPRPETELLIEQLLQRFDRQAALTIADLGTGSGAIAITLACECPNWTVTATDISAAALKLARKNAATHAARNLHFAQGSWFDALGDACYDIIVSNPPYIASDDPHMQQGDVRFEPQQALSSGADGLDAIRHLSRHAQEWLRPDGWLFVEHGYDQLTQVADCFSRNQFVEITQFHDLAGHPRITAGKKPGAA